MDKLVIVSGALFFLADVFAVASLANPAWVISDDASNFKIGLTSQCLTIFGRDPVCLAPNLSPEWEATLVFIVLGILCLTVTCSLLAASVKKTSALKYARWAAFTAMVLFCIAALIFPVGFYVDEIGGEPYKLPNTVKVGSSYVMFILAIFLTIISELFAEVSVKEWGKKQFAAHGNKAWMKIKFVDITMKLSELECFGHKSMGGSRIILKGKGGTDEKPTKVQ